MTATAGQIAVTVQLGSKTQVVMIEKEWTIDQLYFFALSCYSGEPTVLPGELELKAGGVVLERSSSVRVKDYQLQHMELITYELKKRLQPLDGLIQLTRKPCCVTGDDDQSQIRALMPCGCAIAVESMELLGESTVRAGKHTFTCPGCNAPWEFFLVRHVLSAGMTAENLKTISGQLDENYINSPEQDIRQCMACRTYSVRDFGGHRVQNRNRVVCNVCTKKNGGRTVEFCWLCGQQWRHGPDGECGNANCGGPAQSINILATCAVKTINGVDNIPDTRACPKCGMLISHIEACKHMKCSRCATNFCFVCLKPQNEAGVWQCGDHVFKCPVAPRQTSLPDRLTQ